jgi:hypothetical protein
LQKIISPAAAGLRKIVAPLHNADEINGDLRKVGGNLRFRFFSALES